MPSESLARTFFEAAKSVTQKAFDTHPAHNRDLLIAGLRVRLSFAGNAMPPLVLPALAHLTNPEKHVKPDFTIFIWDTPSTGQALPSFAGKIEDILLRGEISGLNTERNYAAYFPYARLLSLYDAKEGIGIICTSDPTIMPAFEIACPLRSILSWILNTNNKSLIHAAAVGTKDGAVLLGGNGGAGKSSTALRSLISGMLYLGDDICGIDNSISGPVAHSIYSSAKLHTHDAHHFQGLEKTKLLDEKKFHHEKQMYFLSPHFDGQLTSSLPIKAILIPKHSSGPLRMEPISTAYVVKVMTSSTNCLLPRAGVHTFNTLSSLVRKVPCYQFHLGPHPKDVAPAIIDFLEHSRNGP